MPNLGNLLDMGIAINFFGNYRSEGAAIQGITSRIDSGLRSLTQLFVGGSIAYGFQRFMGNIIETGKMMEMQFAQIKGVLGDVGKTMETLNWAKMKGVTTSLSDTEVVDAVVAMTRMGLAKEKADRDKNFDALADFTAMYLKPKGFTFADAVDMVSKASFGNWERLGDNFGMRKQTIGTQWKSAVQAKGITTDETSWEKFTKADVERGDKLVAYLAKAKAGTDEYKKSLVELLGLMSKGGMMATMDTFGGVMSNIMEIPEGFMKSFVGYAQVSGTLWNAVVTQLKNFFGVLSQASANGETAIGNFFRFASDLGGLFVSDINRMGGALQGWAEKIRSFFMDYQNRIAPIVLFLALIKIQVEEFLRAFYEGFRSTFDWFLKAGLGVWEFFIKLLRFFGLTEENGKGVAKTLGQIMGILVGIRVFRMITSPLHQLDLIAGQLLPKIGQVLKGMDDIIFKGRILETMRGLASGEILGGSLIAQLRTYLTSLIVGAEMFSVTIGTSLLTIGLIVVVVIALVAWIGYLVYNWEEVGQRMQSVSDWALILLSVFLPIVGIPLLMAKYWDEFRVIFTNIWEGIKSYLNGVRLWIKGNVINPIRNNFVLAWTFIKTIGNQMLDSLIARFPALASIFTSMKESWKAISEFITKVWQKITDSNFMQGLLKIGEKITGWFREGGESFEHEQILKHGTEEEKRKLYQEIGRSRVTGGSSSNTSNTNNNNVNIHINGAGKNAEQVAAITASKVKSVVTKTGRN